MSKKLESFEKELRLDQELMMQTWNTPLISESDVISDSDDKVELSVAQKWEAIREWRDIAMREIEKERVDGNIRSSLEAELTFIGSENELKHLKDLCDDELRYVMIVSKTFLEVGDGPAVKVKKSTAPKCARCWHHEESADNPEELCERCTKAINGKEDGRKYV